jgi:hypothetical protein
MPPYSAVLENPGGKMNDIGEPSVKRQVRRSYLYSAYFIRRTARKTGSIYGMTLAGG